ncbi:MAG TPA: winged helix DNA-binding protein, partial [Ktedonobacteraceae bacterium]
DIMMTSQVVRALEEKGLFTRTVHPTDTRARVVSLTAEGRTVVQQAMVVVEDVDEQFFHELGEQAPTFVRLMQLLIGAYAESPISSDSEK